jgi:hypothetical protein
VTAALSVGSVTEGERDREVSLQFAFNYDHHGKASWTICRRRATPSRWPPTRPWSTSIGMLHRTRSICGRTAG